MRTTAVGAVMAFMLAWPAVGAGQTVPPGNEWSRATELGVLGGFTSSSVGDGRTFAGIASWQAIRWITIEGRGSWIDRGIGASAFTADLAGVVNLPRRATISPYVGAAFGLYRAAFASTGQVMPDFYSRRMADDSPSPTGAITFTDPVMRFTGGVDIITHRHLTVRPEASLLLVRSDGRTNTMFNVGLRVGYRFEDHPITPSRRGY